MGAATPGEMVISLGTSYTVFAAMQAPRTDPHGFGHVFGNPLGGFMSLICFQNGALACEHIKNSQSLNWNEFDQLASVPPTPDQLPTLPFYVPEISPIAAKTDQSNATVRSLLDGQFLNMKKHAAWMKIHPKNIWVTGGISQSNGVCQTIANVFNTSVQKLKTNASASLGAAIRAVLATSQTSLNQLEQAFCPPETSAIEPDPNTVAIYNILASNFDDLLRQHLSANSP